ncbi:MAG: transglycosylase domain-containing protein [Bacteroidales bacterium]|nr:transglycosylase domain-containing protein [Bacteroidales bacterium]MDT8430654.1 transglycosylase domain-containing protein [Bacteroidales bacterium]
MLKKADKHTVFLAVLWSLYGLAFIFIILLFVLIAKGKMGFMPTFEELENPQTNLASEIYTDNGELLDKFFVENRTLVEYDELSPYLVDALVATEDVRYKRHSGIDMRSLARVAVKSVLMGQDAGGGSTISQQLAKNLFPRDTTQNNTKIGRAAHMAVVKFKEWNTAVRLERSYTKPEILTMYLNTVPFGSDAVIGIKSASRTFFDTSPDSLKLEEAAILVGMLKAPTRYNPYLNPDNAFSRRNVVIDQMVKYDYLDTALADSVKQLPVEAQFNLAGHMQGNANHFRTYLRVSMEADYPVREEYRSYENFRRDSIRWLHDPLYGWIDKNPRPDGSAYNIYRDGLRIYTTINMKMQEYAEEAMAEHLSEYLQPAFFKEKRGRPNAPFEDISREEIRNTMNRAIGQSERYKRLRGRGMPEDSIMDVFNTPREMKVFSWSGLRDTVLSPYDSIRYMKHILRAGFMAMEPGSGQVKAYVGDHNYRYFQYDHVTVGRRQVGSTVKPFLYLLAMQEGVSPCRQIPLVPITFRDRDSTYTPEAPPPNSNAGKYVTLKWGLANSHNWVSAWLFKNYKPENVIQLMRKMGITSHIDPVPAMIYGPANISLEEMVGAFNTFSNQGIYVSPVYVTRIEDKYGNVVSTFQARESEAISEETACLMLSLLKDVVDRGTAYRLRWRYEFSGEIAGKTGTTQNQSDGWFMGITPRLSAGVWVGGEDRSVHFDGLGMGAGGNMALPIWAKFFEKVYADSTLGITQEAYFEQPEDFHVDLDCVDVSDQPSSTDFGDF